MTVTMARKDGASSERGREIGRRIALARREADGMTQRELADLLGVTERSVAAYEAGDVIPYRFMRQLENLLNRPASWILYGEQQQPADEAIMRLTERVEKLIEMLEQQGLEP
jgi:transcriptional regulator with XRE-family HTH domain